MKSIPYTINGDVNYINPETIVRLYVNNLYEIGLYRVEAMVTNNTIPIPLSPCLSEEEAEKKRKEWLETINATLNGDNPNKQ